MANKEIKDDVQFFSFVLKRWQVITAIVGIIIYLASFPILLTRLSQDVNAKADKELVEQQFGAIKDNLSTINLTLQRLVDLHTRN
jgi:hypothetical protein